MHKSIWFFFLCVSLASVVYGADSSNVLSSGDSPIYVGDYSILSANNKQKNLSVLIRGSYANVDLTQAQIDNTLQISIPYDYNTVVIKHPNYLELSITGSYNRVINLCSATKGAKGTINGYKSEYIVSSPLNYFLFGSTLRTFTTLAVAGMLAFFLYKSPWVKNSIQQIFGSKNNPT
jgi:hypothetical protein